jgi:hypothetical protein
MKKLLIGLLIMAAAAGAFFYLRSQDKPISNGVLVKEQLIGTWKLESITSRDDSTSIVPLLIAIADSNTFHYDYEFTKDHSILRRLGDSTSTDTSRYEWKENNLVWKEDRTDSSGNLLTVMTLNTDSLLLLSNDSTLMLFTKRK